MPTDWASVYTATWGDLVRFLHHKVWDADRARDLAQEVFVRALDEDPEDARAWLFTVAANLARDEARGDIRRRHKLELIKSEPAPTAPDPIEEMERGQQLRLVREALALLTDRDRDVLLLWDAGLDYEAIAGETGLT
ncbi:MAG: sigma factor, partial [Gemmatimonadales bacterium]